MRIIVTGAAGMVARAVAEHCTKIGDSVTPLTRDEMNIADRNVVNERICAIGPDAVINCAAYTDVDGAESDAASAERANVAGVENLAAACREIDCAFVTISTDYVFDGRNRDFYTQRNTPNPLGVYGRTKLDGERRGRDRYARTIVVRSGWIYGDGGTNFLSVVGRLLADNKQISAIDDAYGTPTFAGDLAVRLRELAEIDLPGIYHITNRGAGTSYAGFARLVCEAAGYDKNLIKPVSHRQLSRPAPRPESSKLACLFSERVGLSPMPESDDAMRSFFAQEREHG